MESFAKQYKYCYVKVWHVTGYTAHYYLTQYSVLVPTRFLHYMYTIYTYITIANMDNVMYTFHKSYITWEVSNVQRTLKY
jgi:hypothetical protein